MIHGEDQDLKTHVSVCAERYGQIEARFQKIEEKLDRIESVIDKNKLDLSRIFIGGSVTIVSSVLALIGVILTRV